MIVIVVELTIKEGAETRFLEAARKCVAATREEAGNRAYSLLRNPFAPNEFTFLEQWASKESLDIHVATAHFKAFGEAVKDLVTSEAKTSAFQAESLR